MHRIYRKTSRLRLLTTLSLTLLPIQPLGATPQSPVSVTCINLEATPDSGPRHQYVICSPRGCVTTPVASGGCPVK